MTLRCDRLLLCSNKTPLRLITSGLNAISPTLCYFPVSFETYTGRQFLLLSTGSNLQSVLSVLYIQSSIGRQQDRNKWHHIASQSQEFGVYGTDFDEFKIQYCTAYTTVAQREDTFGLHCNACLLSNDELQNVFQISANNDNIILINVAQNLRCSSPALNTLHFLDFWRRHLTPIFILAEDILRSPEDVTWDEQAIASSEIAAIMRRLVQ